MKVVTPEILWHEREPIYSVDLQPLSGNFQRLASCGIDRVVRVGLWQSLHVCWLLCVCVCTSATSCLHLTECQKMFSRMG